MDVAEMLLEEKVDKINEKMGKDTIRIVYGAQAMLYVKGRLVGANVSSQALNLAIDAMYALIQ